MEPYTRLDDISQGLQAQVYDPLWLLARQWQSGEFQGEDSGSPVQARLRMERAPLARFFPGQVAGARTLAGLPYQGELPLETQVEREPVQLPADPRRDLRLAAEAGLYFLRLLEANKVTAALRAEYPKAADFSLTAPADDPAAGQDRAGDGYLSIMSGRVPDGFKLYEALKKTLRPPQPGTPGLPPKPVVSAVDRARVIKAGLAYLVWFEGRYSVPPPGPQTWNPERMEYSFALSASAGAKELALEAPEYPGGSLDWYSFDFNAALRLGITPTDPQPAPVTRTLIPTSVHYPGMASNRWWEFEDGKVNFNRIEGGPDELMRLLLVQFALVYSNDWYVIPVDLTFGAVYRPQSLVVTDTFGERTLVKHYSDLDPAPHDWRVFALSPTEANTFGSSSRSSEDMLFIPPVLAASLHGDPIEDVLVLRDELANLVWAVERLVPGLSGEPLNRYELYHQREGNAPVPPPVPAQTDELSYLLATSTPDHWIPFLPVRIDPALPDIRLRRAAALLDQGDGQPGFTRPLGRFLEPERTDLSLFEEEAPRSGLRLTRQFQYTRWVDGSTFLWLARRKGAGHGEGSAGLHFDQVK